MSDHSPLVNYRVSEDGQDRITENGLDTRIIEGALVLASVGTAAGTSTAAAISTAVEPPFVVILPGGRVRVQPQRIIAAEGHAFGTSSCRAVGRRIVAANARAAGKAAGAVPGAARRYLHDDELAILLEAA